MSRLDYKGGVVAVGTTPPTGGGGGGGGGGTTTTRAALIGTSIGTLNSQSPADGEIGLLRLGTWPDLSVLQLTYYAAQSKWVSDPIIWVTQTDTGYMTAWASGSATTTDRYVSQGAISPGQTGWTTRYLDNAAAIIGAGMSLHMSVTSVMNGDGTNVAILTPYVYADLTTVSNVQHVDGSGNPFAGGAGANAVNVILGPTCTSIASAHPALSYSRTGWVNTPFTVTPTGGWTNRVLWCGLFMKMSPAGTAVYGKIIDTDVRVRWVG